MQPQIRDETLVAYLDGELPTAERTTIEQTIKSDSELQQRIEQLRSTWALLGELPDRPPRRDLAQSTIEIVTLSMERESRSWKGWLSQNRWLAILFSGVLMLAAGAASSMLLTRYMTRQILANLPVIVAYRSLQNIDSVEFLDKLTEVPNLIEAAKGSGGPALIGDGFVPLDISQRRAWVENLAEVDLGRLESNLIDFQPLSDARRGQLNSLTDRIYEEPAQAPKYLAAIRAYHVILDKLGAKRGGLLQNIQNVDKRIEAIDHRVRVLMAAKYAPGLEDRLALRKWLDDLQFKDEDFDRLLFYDPDSLIIGELMYGDPEISYVTQPDVADLIDNHLSSTARKLLLDLKDESLQRTQLGVWISAVVQPSLHTGTNPTSGGSVVSEVDLMARFKSLPRERQDELEFLPEDEVRSELRKALPSPAGVLPGNLPAPH